MTQPTSSLAGLARDAAAPLLLLAALATALLATSAVWVAAGIATLLGTGSWTTPAWSLALLPRLLTNGAIRPVIDSTFEFARIREAHARVDSKRKRGAVIVTV